MNEIKRAIEENIFLNKAILDNTTFHSKIIKAYQIILECVINGGKILVCGNGGSAADSSHFATELIGKFKIFSNPYPAISLNSDGVLLTALGNDYKYEELFYRQILALMKKNDTLLAISTSGSSPNIIKAIDGANKVGGKTIFLTSDIYITKSCYCDVEISVPSKNVPRIQECHTMVLHIICELLEKELHRLNI